MKNLKIELVDDAHEFLKWSSMRVSALLAALYLALPHLIPMLADHWPEIAPWVMHFFPNAQASVVPVIGLMLVMLARLTKISRGDVQ
jgi:hypothetical protein